MFLKKNKKYTLNEIILIWLESKNDIKIQSYQKYSEIINKYIFDTIGKKSIITITPNDIQNLFQKYNNDKVSISSQRTILYIIKTSILYGYKAKLCNYIDLNHIKLRQNPKTIYVFSKSEQNIIENNIRNKMNIRKLCLLLCLYTGLRIGEICGLKWEDINLNTKSLVITKTIERIKNTDSTNSSKTILITSTPKSETSKRTIPIPDFIGEYLKKFQTKEEYYLLSNSTKLYDPRQFQNFYARFLKKCNIDYKNFHTIRHTFATRSIESKMDIKTLSEILGHSSVEITLRLYVHPSYELKKASIENLVNFMSEEKYNLN